MAFLHNKSIDKVRVLVCGDSYVGKTSLVHLICHDKVLSTSPWTIGCKAEVKMHEYNHTMLFVEMIDVGGSQKYENSRSIFYSNFNGLILVHDITNKKSFSNLRKWIKEILNIISPSETHKWVLRDEKQQYQWFRILELQHEDPTVSPIPILIFAAKSDLNPNVSHDSSYLKDDVLGRDSIFVNSLDPNCFSQNNISGVRLDAFISRVIYNATTPRTSSSVASRSPLSPGFITRQRSATFERPTKYEKGTQLVVKNGIVYVSDEDSPHYPVSEACLSLIDSGGSYKDDSCSIFLFICLFLFYFFHY